MKQGKNPKKEETSDDLKDLDDDEKFLEDDDLEEVSEDDGDI